MKTKKELTKKEVMKVLKVIPKESHKKTVCALIGHSKIQTVCFGYFYCGRCGEQVGDNLGSVYPEAKDVVVVEHKCPKCKANFKKLTWKDKFLAQKPF